MILTNDCIKLTDDDGHVVEIFYTDDIETMIASIRTKAISYKKVVRYPLEISKWQ